MSYSYILIVFYATVAGAGTNYASSQVQRSHAVVMQEFGTETACKAAMKRVMEAGASASCLSKN